MSKWILIFLSIINIASATVYIKTDVDMTVSSDGTESLSLYYENSSGDVEAYIPYTKTGTSGVITTDVDSLNFVVTEAAVTNPTKFYAPIANESGGTDTNPRFNVTIYHDVTSTSQDIYVAAKLDNGEYKIYDDSGTQNPVTTALASGDSNTYTVSLGWERFCSGTESHACTIATDTSVSNASAEIYIFSVDEGTTLDNYDDVDKTTYPDGISLELNFKGYTSTDTIGSLTFNTDKISRADSGAKVDLDTVSGFTGNDLYRVYVLDLTDHVGTLSACTPLSNTIPRDLFTAATNQISQTYYENVEAGDYLDIKDLSNGQTYQLALVQVNRYQLSTQVSDVCPVTAEEIQAFVRKQQCYLISAGFQTDHPVLTYYRALRDQYLLKWSWGKAFVDAYYATAPRFAHYIYESKSLSWLVKTFSTIAHYPMQLMFPIKEQKDKMVWVKPHESKK